MIPKELTPNLFPNNSCNTDALIPKLAVDKQKFPLFTFYRSRKVTGTISTWNSTQTCKEVSSPLRYSPQLKPPREVAFFISTCCSCDVVGLPHLHIAGPSAVHHHQVACDWILEVNREWCTVMHIFIIMETI